VTTNQSLTIIGDVHGDVAKLEVALKAAESQQGGVVLLGDYINRGPDSKGVLDLLAAASCSLGDRLTLVRGNHEAALLKYLDTGDVALFLHHGGLTTIRSYYPIPPVNILHVFRRDFPLEHRKLLESTVACFERPGLLISHCGYNARSPDSRTLSDMTLGFFPEIFCVDATPPCELVVCGHYVQRSREPFVSDHLICLDTGCGTYPDAPLTALILPERNFLAYR
jgi:serine/threonine protein phosphatase 1